MEKAIIALAEMMLEECHVEARFSKSREDMLVILAKRDALSELLKRVKTGQRNQRWARIMPTLTTGLS